MKLKHQVTSLKLSKKLKELGVKQESLFEWVNTNLGKWKILGHWEMFPDVKVSAFTCSELGEMLPGGTSSYKFYYSEADRWDWACIPRGKFDRKTAQYEGSEANARAKMLIYLIEDKLLISPALN